MKASTNVTLVVRAGSYNVAEADSMRHELQEHSHEESSIYAHIVLLCKRTILSGASLCSCDAVDTTTCI